MARFATMFAVFCVLCAPAFTQSADPAFGIPPFSTVTGSKFDSIDLATSNVILTLPLRNKIGKTPFTSGIIGGGRMYQSPATTYSPLPTWTPDSGNYFEPVFGQGMQLYFYEAYTQQCGSQPNDPVYTGFAAIDASGISHSLMPSGVFYMDEYGCLGPTTATLKTSDGPGYTATINSASLTSSALYDRFGNSVSLKAALLTDPDNVSMTIPLCAACADSNISYIDTLGETALTVASSANNYGLTKASYSYTDVNTNTQSYTVTYTDISLATNFRCSGVNDITGTPNTFPLPTQVTAPDGGVYTVSYEPTPGKAGYVTGRIAKITLPMGGYISYQYTGGNNGISCGGSVVPMLTRTINDGNGNNAIWTYVNNQTAFNQVGVTVKVTDPAGNLTVVSFDGSLDGYQTESQFYQGSGGTPLVTTITCYNGTFTNCTTTNAGPRAAAITQTDVFTYGNGSSSGSLLETKYDSYGDVTEVRQYDIGAVTSQPPAGAPTVSPLSDTTTVYGTWNASSSSCSSMSSVNSTIGAYMHAYPCTVTIVNSAGTMVSQKRYTYNAGGHPVQTQTWVSGTMYLTASATYNSSGVLSTSTDVDGSTVSTYNYSTGCANILPSSITVTGPSLPSGGLTASTQWNCNGALTTQNTDYNGQPTTYAYNDPLWRITSMTDPIGNLTNYSYPSQTLSETAMNFASASTSDTLMTTDGLGRPIIVQKRQGQGSSNFDSTQTTYGWTAGTGAFATVSVPYVATSIGQAAPSGTPITTTQNDAFSRPLAVSVQGGGNAAYSYAQNDILFALGPASPGENLKQIQTQYDALGRPTSSCALSASVSGEVVCGQTTNTSATGVLTTASYTATTGSQTTKITRGSQQRTTIPAGLGRVTSSTTPEGGTVSSFYDTVPSACSGSATAFTGKLIESLFANGNFRCYQYDALGRIIAITGIIPGVSALCDRFYYDTSSGATGVIPSGITVSYPDGRMVEAETDACNTWPLTAASIITDEWFSYDAGGRMTDMWELTPHSTQYYYSKAGFAGNGTVTSLQLVSPSLYTMDYGLDGEGRWDTLTQNSTRIVTGPAYPAPMYNANGQPLEVDLTDNDKDVFTYSSYTGKMSQYEFEVGGANEIGVLTWNPNNTVQNLVITDGFNSGGSQTCASSYDDLARLAVFDCGSGNWGQDFAYDQYDNLTQTVPSGRSGSTWNPGYNVSYNYVTGATYDASGDMTKDGGTNVYGYNWFNKLAWTAGSGTPTCGTSGKCITYDAFGRMVEKSSGSAWTEIWYTQVPSSQINMNGKTANYGYWPSPGRGTFVATGTNTFLHQDWLGNDRIVSATGLHTVSADRAYAPYGEQYDTFGSTNPVFGMFAGLTGDFDSGVLFDTPNRELAQYQGRWLSPDPAGQGWNQYAYVMNNPLSNIDPTGLGGPGQCGPAGCNVPGTVNCGGSGGIPGQGGCNTSGNFPSLANIMGSWSSFTSVTTTSVIGWVQSNLYGIDPDTGQLVLTSQGQTAVTQTNTYIVGSGGGSFAGVLPPGMNGPAIYAKWATRGRPPTNLPNPQNPIWPQGPPPEVNPPVLPSDVPWYKAIPALLMELLDNFNVDIPVMVDPCLMAPAARCGPYAPPQA
jgi:RHS repeat-associated protein